MSENFWKKIVCFPSFIHQNNLFPSIKGRKDCEYKFFDEIFFSHISSIYFSLFRFHFEESQSLTLLFKYSTNITLLRFRLRFDSKLRKTYNIFPISSKEYTARKMILNTLWHTIGIEMASHYWNAILTLHTFFGNVLTLFCCW